MASFRYKTGDDGVIRIIGQGDYEVATLSELADGQWQITPAPTWALSEGFNFGPFATKEDALAELDAH